MIIKWTQKFFPYKRNNWERIGVNIRMRLTMRGRTPVDISTGFNMAFDLWDVEKQRPKKEYADAGRLNALIDEWRSVASDIMNRYEIIEKRLPTSGELRDLFNDMIGRETEITRRLPPETLEIFDAIDAFTSQMGEQNAWTPSTFEKFKTMKNHLKLFDPLLSFPQITDAKLQSYVAYLQKKDFKNTTIAKQLSFVRWFLKWAHHQGYYQGLAHESFRPKFKGIDPDSHEVIYLTRDELQKVEEYQFSDLQKSMERVRDVFVFCCYTGLRYSDVAKLRRNDISNGIIHVVTQKTNDGLRIELNSHSRAILDKYKDVEIPGGLALPVISNVKMNAQLKHLGQTVGLDEPTRYVYFKGKDRFEEVHPKWQLLTTHVARRTFVVMALQLGIPVEVIMRWTGHSRYDAMRPYIAIVDELKKNSMSRFDKI